MRIPKIIGTATFLAAWLTPWRPAFRVRPPGSKLSFYVHHRDLIGRHIAKYGTHEPVPTRWIDNYLRTANPGLFVDVGANLGWHAIHAAQLPAVETVVAFEPDPFNVWLLDRNLAENGVTNAIVNATAVGAASGVARLHRYKSSNYGRHSLLTDYGFGSRNVPIVDLDSALERLGLGGRPVAVIKIDVEGYEPAVIAGASKTLERTGAVILEYSPDLGRAGGLQAEAMLEVFKARGFSPYALDDNGNTVALKPGALHGFAGQMDLVFLRNA
ncbi:MAG: FkbM family methyltransferase [Pseudolabrys sp.]